jgi:hypothetical protein
VEHHRAPTAPSTAQPWWASAADAASMPSWASAIVGAGVRIAHATWLLMPRRPVVPSNLSGRLRPPAPLLPAASHATTSTPATDHLFIARRTRWRSRPCNLRHETDAGRSRLRVGDHPLQAALCVVDPRALH